MPDVVNTDERNQTLRAFRYTEFVRSHVPASHCTSRMLVQSRRTATESTRALIRVSVRPGSTAPARIRDTTVGAHASVRVNVLALRGHLISI